MSLRSVTSSHLVAIQKLTTTQETSLGSVDSWSTVATLRCRIRPLRATERLQFGRQGVEVTHRLYFSADPAVDGRSRVLFGNRIFEDPQTVNFDEANRLWAVDVREITAKAT